MASRIEFVMRGVRADTAEALRQYALHRLSFALRPFAHRVQRVTVRVFDENGPRGGVDSRCSIAAERVDGGRLFVEATAAWPFAAITLAAARLAGVLRRDTGRHAARRADCAAERASRRDGDARVS